MCEFPHCGAEAIQVHHRRPRGEGGDPRPTTNRPSNLLHLCLKDHLWIESNREIARDVFGLLIPKSVEDPSTVPVVTRYSTGPVLLDNEGGWTTTEGTS